MLMIKNMIILISHLSALVFVLASAFFQKTVLHNVSHLLAILALEFAPTVLLDMLSTPLVPVFPIVS